jgi:serine/threonine protein phosphatase PrpC
MSTFIEQSNKTMEIELKQALSAQDFISSGSFCDAINGRRFDYMLSADGHGTSFCIDILRELHRENKIEEYLNVENPMIKLGEFINSHYTFKKSGFCCVIVKIYQPIDKEHGIVKSWCVGDSQSAIIKNSELVYISCPHNLTNPSEVERLKEIRHLIQPCDSVPKISTKTSVIPRKAQYINFISGVNSSIAMSQALGHNGITGLAPEYYEHIFTDDDKIRVVIGSDGFWEQYIFEGPCQEDVDEDLRDLTTMSAKQLINKMEARWKQMWKYYWIKGNTEKFVETDYPEDGIDDINVGVWDCNIVPFDQQDFDEKANKIFEEYQMQKEEENIVVVSVEL